MTKVANTWSGTVKTDKITLHPRLETVGLALNEQIRRPRFSKQGSAGY